MSEKYFECLLWTISLDSHGGFAATSKLSTHYVYRINEYLVMQSLTSQDFDFVLGKMKTNAGLEKS